MRTIRFEDFYAEGDEAEKILMRAAQIVTEDRGSTTVYEAIQVAIMETTM